MRASVAVLIAAVVMVLTAGSAYGGSWPGVPHGRNVARDVLNVRAGPGTDHPAVAKLRRDHHMIVREVRGDWGRIETDRRTPAGLKTILGWVYLPMTSHVWAPMP